MKNKNDELTLYRIIPKYIDCLSDESKGGDKRVQQVRNKETRPFIGIVTICNDKKYCIPLTKIAGKEKLSGKGGTKKGSIDYSPIYLNGQPMAGIQFSRMIPVVDNVIREVDTKNRKHDSKIQSKNKELLREEIKWIKENKDVITNKAKTLYVTYVSGEQFNRKKDCLDFPSLEKIAERYENEHPPLHHKDRKRKSEMMRKIALEAITNMKAPKVFGSAGNMVKTEEKSETKENDKKSDIDTPEGSDITDN